MNVSPIEFAWVSINLITLVLTVSALVDARADRTAVRLLNGKARELAANGIVRREVFRVHVQLLLLFVALPGLFIPDGQSRGPTMQALTIGALMAVPVLLLAASVFDARDRKVMTVLVVADALNVKTDALTRLEAAIEENTRISQEASDHADKAYHEANSVNEKIASQGAQILAIAEDDSTDRLQKTVDQTAVQVNDLHEGTAPEKAS